MAIDRTHLCWRKVGVDETLKAECYNNAQAMRSQKMEELATAYNEQLRMQKINYEGGFVSWARHAEIRYQQTIQEGHVAIEQVRIETQNTAERLHAVATQDMSLGAREIFNGQKMEALDIQHKVMRLESCTRQVEA